MEKKRLESMKIWVKQMQGYGVEIANDILALIDAALTEPNDADVAEAIEYFGEVLPYMAECEGEEHYTIAITALRQYQKPTDEAVQRAICWLETGKYNTVINGRPYSGNQAHTNVTKDVRETSITALKQCQKPTNEQTRDDIRRIEQHMKHHWAKEYPHAEHITASLGRAIQALRQMGSTEHSTDSTRVTEPCE